MQTYIKKKSIKITYHYINITSFNLSSNNFHQCYYEILGVKPSASQEELKKAYYDKGKKILLKYLIIIYIVKLFHPDTNKDPDAEVI